jgi:hypothetical protein
MIRRSLVIYSCFALLASGCRDQHEPASTAAHDVESAPPTAADRVDIPPTVRKNLGITFAKVEVREVSRTIRVPGSFELAPEALREYRTMAGGRVELYVAQYVPVEPGQLLYTLDSPNWRELQQRLNETELELHRARASTDAMGPLLAAHERHHAELEKAVAIWAARVAQLESSRATGVVTDEEIAQARATLAGTRSDLAEVLEKEAELRLREAQIAAEHVAHQERLELLLANASSMLSRPIDELIESVANSPKPRPRWREIRRIEVRAESPGVVESLAMTNGGWATESRLVLTTVQPDRLRFRAQGLQADLPKLAGRATARIAPPRTTGLNVGDAVAAELHLGLDAHPDNRTITLIAIPAALRSWMRPGVSAFLEVVVEGPSERTLAIPSSAIVRDGITHVFFRRDQKNPNQAIRVEADMGVEDGRWVVIHSGLMHGDEVVLNGAYELKLATAQSGASQKGGHFHADGAFHDEH